LGARIYYQLGLRIDRRINGRRLPERLQIQSWGDSGSLLASVLEEMGYVNYHSYGVYMLYMRYNKCF